MKNRYIGYKVVANIIKLIGNVWFGGRVLGKDNIPKEGPFILAGNHTSNYDAYLLYKEVKRPIHFLGKKELFDGKMSWFFKMMHLIPVDRKNKNPEARQKALDILKEGKIIGIFPEGTYRKTTLLLPFKPGAVDFSIKSGAPIIPFAMDGKWHFRSKPKIIFGKPIYMNKVKCEDKISYLEDKVKELLLEIKKSNNN